MSAPHPPAPFEAVLDWPDEASCRRAAERLAALWASLGSPSDGADARGTLTLDGPLGAGKTAFCRHLLRALGVTGAVRSPTYTLVEPYAIDRPGAPLRLAHCDFYRFEDPAEWEEAGLRELFTDAGMRLVEWPARAEGRLGPVDLALRIEPVMAAPTGDPPERTGTGASVGGAPTPVNDDGAAAPRRVEARALSAAGRQWLARLAEPGSASASALADPSAGRPAGARAT